MTEGSKPERPRPLILPVEPLTKATIFPYVLPVDKPASDTVGICCWCFDSAIVIPLVHIVLTARNDAGRIYLPRPGSTLFNPAVNFDERSPARAKRIAEIYCRISHSRSWRTRSSVSFGSARSAETMRSARTPWDAFMRMRSPGRGKSASAFAAAAEVSK